MSAQATVHARGIPDWISTVNPVYKIVAILPVMILTLLISDPYTPTIVSLFTATVLMLSGRLTRKHLLLGILFGAVFMAWISVFMAVTVRREKVIDTPLIVDGWIELHAGALVIGYATAARIFAILLLALLGSLGTTIDGLVSALIHQCRVPYRFAFGTASALRFIPGYKRDLDTLRMAHRARGVIDPVGLVGAVRRTSRSIIPLMAGGIRHAERLSLAMDARGFGAFPNRRDRNPAVVRARDIVFLAGIWMVFASILVMGKSLGVLEFTQNMYQYELG